MEKDAQGRIKYRAGSPAIHLLRRDFIQQFASGEIKLPYHRAEKKVAHLNQAGKLIEPDNPNAVKFETFVFDALPLAKNPVILEADRLDQFSPVKNRTGVDSLESSQADQIKRAKRWLKTRALHSKKAPSWKSAPEPFPIKKISKMPIGNDMTCNRILFIWTDHSTTKPFAPLFCRIRFARKEAGCLDETQAALEGITTIHNEGMSMVQKCPIRHPLKLGGSDGDHSIIRFVEGQLLPLVPGNDSQRAQWGRGGYCRKPPRIISVRCHQSSNGKSGFLLIVWPNEPGDSEEQA